MTSKALHAVLLLALMPLLGGCITEWLMYQEFNHPVRVITLHNQGPRPIGSVCIEEVGVDFGTLLSGGERRRWASNGPMPEQFVLQWRDEEGTWCKQAFKLPPYYLKSEGAMHVWLDGTTIRTSEK